MQCIKCQSIVDECGVKERTDGPTIKAYTECQCFDGGRSQRKVAAWYPYLAEGDMVIENPYPLRKSGSA